MVPAASFSRTFWPKNLRNKCRTLSNSSAARFKSMLHHWLHALEEEEEEEEEEEDDDDDALMESED